MKKIIQNRGSLTLEAAIMVPMFIIIMLVVNGLFLLFMGQQIMLHTLVQSAKSLSYDVYATQRAENNKSDSLTEMALDLFSIGSEGYMSTEQWYKEDGDLEGAIEDRFKVYLAEDESAVDKTLELVGVENGFSGLDFSGSSIEDGMLNIKLNYTQEFVFNAAGLGSIDRELTAKVRLFEYRTAG